MNPEFEKFKKVIAFAKKVLLLHYRKEPYKRELP